MVVYHRDTYNGGLAALAEVNSKVKKGKEKKDPPPPPSSHPALHCEEIVAAACTSAAATSGEDLMELQTTGLKLLGLLLNMFGNMCPAFGCISTVICHLKLVRKRVRRSKQCIAFDSTGVF